MSALDRRRFLQLSALAAAPLFPAPYSRLAAALRRKVKITDVKCMIVRGTWWSAIRGRRFGVFGECHASRACRVIVHDLLVQAMP